LLVFRNTQKDPDIKTIRETIESDANFMRKCKFLDYSILLAIEKTAPFSFQQSSSDINLLNKESYNEINSRFTSKYENKG